MWNLLRAELSYHKSDLAIIYTMLTIFLSAFTTMEYKTFDKRMIYMSIFTLVGLAVFLIVWKNNNRVSLHRHLPITPLAHALSRIFVHVVFAIGSAAVMLTIVFLAMPESNNAALLRTTTFISFLIITSGLFLILMDVKADGKNRFAFYASLTGFFLVYMPLWMFVLFSYEPLSASEGTENDPFTTLAQTSNPLILLAFYVSVAIILAIVDLYVFKRRKSYIEK